ncbi:hypothetical protein ACTFIW_005245 [Dictyostelium discoideum]
MEFNNKSNIKYQNDVAIIGLGFRLPGNSNSPKLFWNNLINKFDGVVELDRWSKNYYLNNEIKNHQGGLISLEEQIKMFDPLFFSIPPSDAETIDPQQRILLKCVWEGFEDANIDPIKLRGSNTSVYIGLCTNDYFNNLKNPKENLTNIFGTSAHSASNRISYCYDFRGQSISIDSACSGSSNAISLGYQSIIEGKSNYSIVGGSNLILDPMFPKAFSHLNMLSSNGRCKVFDKDADGFVRGEGIGIVILKNLTQAIKDGDKIYCIINGTNSNADGNFDKNNFYSPSKTGQYENINQLFSSLKMGGGVIKESDIDYCETHGTGTPIGDPIEVEGISMAFSKYHSSDNPLLIGSVKSNIAHLEACSGIASLIKCCLMFKYRKFIPNIHFNEPNPLIKFKEWNLKVVTQVTPFPNNKKVSMLINNFGITSSNVAIVLSEFNYNEYSKQLITYKPEINKSYFIPISANSKQSLNNYISIINKDNNISCDFFDFVQTQILSKSTSLYQRAVISAKNWIDLKEDKNIIKTNSSITSNMKSASEALNNNNNNQQHQQQNIICFIFSGQGTQLSHANFLSLISAASVISACIEHLFLG